MASPRKLLRIAAIVGSLRAGKKRDRESFIHRALIESNRKLIEIFEAKIKAKLDEIWGGHDEN